MPGNLRQGLALVEATASKFCTLLGERLLPVSECDGLFLAPELTPLLFQLLYYIAH